MKPRKNVHGRDEKCWANAFYGAVTVGERGQIVIPAEARSEMGWEPGEKVLVMRHPVHSGLMLFKIEAVREFVEDFQKNLDELEKATGAEA